MWSEHCGYKHSRRLLKSLPTEGPRLVMGPGENAGAVDVGNGLACAFKVESHNHPSAVEPFEGAATGVGGILRDIFAIGARPIAILDSLRFGEVGTSARSRYLLERAVAGIGHYGNSIGIATVGGEIYFEGPYEQNCLVNAMALGLIETDKLIRSAAAGIGNIVVLFGAKTGRDGIGGASVLASRRARRLRGQAPDGADRRPVHREEAARVLAGAARPRAAGRAAGPRRRGPHLLVVGDGGQGRGRARPRGAQGAAARGRHGAVRDHGLGVAGADAVRGRAVQAPGGARGLRASWEVDGTAIGKVTDTRRLRVFDDGALVGDMPVTALVDECPAYDLEPAEPVDAAVPGAACRLIDSDEPGEILVTLLGSSNVASRKWAFEQYDALVGSRTVRRPEQADAAVLMLPTPGQDPLTALYPADGDGPRRAIAVAIDGNGRRVAADPYRGAVEAVLECSANLACVGAEPLGLTNCLNFGNPEKPHIAWQFTRAVAGLGDACRAFGIPVVGGNVSLYNEGAEGPIYPTPVVGLVGELPDARRAGRLGFVAEGDAIALVTAGWAPSLAASELSKLRGEAVVGPLPAVDLGRAEGAARRDPPGRPLRRPALGARRRRGWRRDRAGRGLPGLRAGRHGFRSVVLTPSCSARALARSWSPARPTALAAFGVRGARHRLRGRRSLTIEGVLSVAVDELRPRPHLRTGRAAALTTRPDRRGPR